MGLHSVSLSARSPQTHSGNRYVGLLQQDGRLYGSYSQNQIRQASVSPHSAQSGSLSVGAAINGGHSQRFSTSSYEQSASRPAQSSVRLVQSSLVSKPTWYSAQEVPNHSPFGLSSAVASGNSVSRVRQNQKGLTDTRKYTSGSSSYSQTPSESYPQQSVAQRQTSASAPARRVSPHKSRASGVSSARAIARNVPNQAAALPSNVKVSYRPGYTSTDQWPTSRNHLQASWGIGSAAPGAQNLPVFGPNLVGNSTLRFAPSRTYEIPEVFGGHAIRRLGGLNEAVVQKPQTAPPQQMAHLHPSNSEQLYTQWLRLRLRPRRQN